MAATDGLVKEQYGCTENRWPRTFACLGRVASNVFGRASPGASAPLAAGRLEIVSSNACMTAFGNQKRPLPHATTYAPKILSSTPPSDAHLTQQPPSPSS
jgi:hypothetical protein